MNKTKPVYLQSFSAQICSRTDNNNVNINIKISVGCIGSRHLARHTEESYLFKIIASDRTIQSGIELSNVCALYQNQTFLNRLI